MTTSAAFRLVVEFCTRRNSPIHGISRMYRVLSNQITYSHNFRSHGTTQALAFSSNSVLNSQIKFPTNLQVSKDALHNFAEKINWSLSSEELLINALTHKSFLSQECQNSSGSSFSHNERLIFLGYQTASSFITEIVYFKLPSLTADQLWDLQNGLLREDLIADCGRKLGLSDLILAKDELDNKIIAEALLAIIGSIYMDQAPGFARQFVENFMVPDLTEEMIKEICQLQHPKFMLKLLISSPVKAKVLEKYSKKNIYGEEVEEYKVGIYTQEDELIAEACGNCQLKAEKNACQQILRDNYLEKLKKAKFPLDCVDYMSEDEVNLGLLTEGLRVVELEKGDGGFGFCIKGGEIKAEENEEYLKYNYYSPPFVSSIIEGGAAERNGDLKVGDVILAINDKNIKEMSHDSVVNFLNSIKDNVKLTVKYSKKVIITDELETKFAQFKENKLLSQLTDRDWAQWHHAHSKENEDEYKKLLRKDFGQDESHIKSI